MNFTAQYFVDLFDLFYCDQFCNSIISNSRPTLLHQTHPYLIIGINSVQGILSNEVPKTNYIYLFGKEFVFLLFFAFFVFHFYFK